MLPCRTHIGACTSRRFGVRVKCTIVWAWWRSSGSWSWWEARFSRWRFTRGRFTILLLRCRLVVMFHLFPGFKSVGLCLSIIGSTCTLSSPGILRIPVGSARRTIRERGIRGGRTRTLWRWSIWLASGWVPRWHFRLEWGAEGVVTPGLDPTGIIFCSLRRVCKDLVGLLYGLEFGIELHLLPGIPIRMVFLCYGEAFVNIFLQVFQVYGELPSCLNCFLTSSTSAVG